MSANDPKRTLSFAQISSSRSGCRGLSGYVTFASRRNAVAWEDIMKLMHVFVASTAAFLILGSGAAKAGQTINDVGAIACVNDKWDVSLKRTQVDRLRGSMRKDPRRSHRTEV